MSDVEIFSDRSALIRAEAERFVKLAGHAIAARGRFVVALSGGSTPKPLYELLATPPYAGRIDWSRCTCSGATSAACRPIIPSPTIG